ncbi:MAG: DMT family transporter [Actinomycetota bacterium]|nr:DMT family transporter [Actinomycetota bacterium]
MNVPNDRSRLPLAELGLVGVAAVWGLTFPMVKDAVAGFPVTTFLAYRFLAAFVLVALISLASPRGLRRLDRRGWIAGIVMGVFLTGGYVLQTLGLERTSASNAGFITGLFVVLTPVFGALFLRQRAGPAAWIAAGVSAFGLFLLSRTGGTGDVEGDLLVLGCACCFAFHILATARAVEEHDVGALLAVQLAVCGFSTFGVATAAGDLSVPEGSSLWLALVVTAFFATAVGFYIQTYAQRRTSASRTALILASEPAFAGLFAYLLLGETLTLPGWAGALLILGSIVAVEVVPYLRPVRPLPEG